MNLCPLFGGKLRPSYSGRIHLSSRMRIPLTYDGASRGRTRTFIHSSVTSEKRMFSLYRISAAYVLFRSSKFSPWRPSVKFLDSFPGCAGIPCSSASPSRDRETLSHRARLSRALFRSGAPRGSNRGRLQGNMSTPGFRLPDLGFRKRHSVSLPVVYDDFSTAQYPVHDFIGSIF